MLNFILCGVLLASALVIIFAVIFQKSADEGLSGTIAGGNETFYGKEKSAHGDKLWFKVTLVVSIVFVLAVLAAYVVQPDYNSAETLDSWMHYTQDEYFKVLDPTDYAQINSNQ